MSVIGNTHPVLKACRLKRSEPSSRSAWGADYEAITLSIVAAKYGTEPMTLRSEPADGEVAP